MLNSQRGKIIFLKNLVHLPGIYLFLLKNVRKQKRFIKKELEPELKPFRIKNDGSLSEVNFKKITDYYAMGVPSILGESLCVLRGRSMSREERLCMSYLGGLSGLMDDLFDEPEKSADHLENFILNPEKLVPANTHEKLLKNLYLKGLSFSPQPDKIKNAALKVFKAQQLSLFQKRQEKKIGLENITFCKGGNSFIFYRLCLSHPLVKSENEMLFQMGGLMQLGNDIFDVWEDTRDHIATLATKTTNIEFLRNYFLNELDKTLVLTKTGDYDNKQVKRFQRMINLGISRVFVCLDQFEKLSFSTGGEFRVEKYTRKQLICDMQKPSNQLKAIGYYLKLNQT